MRMGVTVHTGSPILAWVNSALFVIFVCTEPVQTKVTNQCRRNINVTAFALAFHNMVVFVAQGRLR